MVRLGILSFCVLALVLSPITAESGLWGSARHRQGKLQNVTPMKVTSVKMLTNCVHLCEETVNCTAVQHNVSTKN